MKTFLLRALQCFGGETIVGVIRAANHMKAAEHLKLPLLVEDVGGSRGEQHYVYIRDYPPLEVAGDMDPRIAAHLRPESGTRALYLMEIPVLAGDEPELPLQGRERSPEDFSA